MGTVATGSPGRRPLKWSRCGGDGAWAEGTAGVQRGPFESEQVDLAMIAVERGSLGQD